MHAARVRWIQHVVRSLLLAVVMIAALTVWASAQGEKTFQGEAISDKTGTKFPAVIRVKEVNDATGEFTGEISWTSLNAVHKIVGRIDGKTLIFRETEFIKKGKAVLDVEYAFIYHKGQLTGRWYDPTNDYGTAMFKEK